MDYAWRLLPHHSTDALKVGPIEHHYLTHRFPFSQSVKSQIDILEFELAAQEAVNRQSSLLVERDIAQDVVRVLLRLALARAQWA